MSKGTYQLGPLFVIGGNLILVSVLCNDPDTLVRGELDGRPDISGGRDPVGVLYPIDGPSDAPARLDGTVGAFERLDDHGKVCLASIRGRTARR